MVSKRIVLKFPARLLDQPIVCQLVKRHGLDFSILKASVTPREEGLLVLEISGEENAIESGMGYLAEVGVRVQPLSQDVLRDEARCTHCGACVTICPTRALSMDRRTMRVSFNSDQCIACEHCVAACPVRAMEIHF